MLIGHILMAKIQNVWTCLLSLTPLTVLGYLASNTSMCLSGIRYYTKLKAEQSQTVNTRKVISFIKYNKIFSYLIQIIVNFLCYWFQIEVEFTLCANTPMISNEDNWHIVLIVCILHYVLYLIHIFTSLFFEVKLKLLFKTAKKNWLNLNRPDHLAPWRAVGANLDENNIPQKSTYILICFHALALMGISFYEGLFAVDDSLTSKLNHQCIALLIGSIWLIFHLPITLIFTYNHAYNLKILERQPPAELQYHGTSIPDTNMPLENNEETDFSAITTWQSTIVRTNSRSNTNANTEDVWNIRYEHKKSRNSITFSFGACLATRV